MRLREWKDSNGKKVSTTSGSTSSTKLSGGSTKRFGKLLNYHIAHKDKDVDKIVQKEINPYGFTYAEHHTDGIGGYTKKIHALMNARGDWTFSVFSDGKEVDRKNGKGWDTFVWEISFYLALPPVTTDPEYQDLLEWVDAKGQKVSHSTSSAPQSTSSTSSKTNKEKFEELTDYMINNRTMPATTKAEVVRLDDGGFTYKETRETSPGRTYVLTALVGYSRFNSQWRLEVYMDTKLVDEQTGNGFKELISHLHAFFSTPSIGSQKYKDLCESAGSIADDFKLYENLWD